MRFLREIFEKTLDFFDFQPEMNFKAIFERAFLETKKTFFQNVTLKSRHFLRRSEIHVFSNLPQFSGDEFSTQTNSKFLLNSDYFVQKLATTFFAIKFTIPRTEQLTF